VVFTWFSHDFPFGFPKIFLGNTIEQRVQGASGLGITPMGMV